MKKLVALFLLLSLLFLSFRAPNEIEEPFNLKVVVNGTDALFSWNNQFFIDNMEGHNNFSIHNIGDYILYDGDGSQTYSILGSTFPNQGYTGSYIVFNPSLVSPPMTAPEIQPHSGNKFLACFAATESANNDWLILPKQYIHTGTIFKFWAKTYDSEAGGLERFIVSVSTTGSLPPNGFTQISFGNYIQAPIVWTEYTYDLSAYVGKEIHIAITCVSDDAHIFMVDDIFLGVPGKEAGIPSAKNFTGFTVYLDGAEVASNLEDMEYLFTNLSEGTYTAGVKAVYTTGESEIITKKFIIGSGCLAPTNFMVSYTNDCHAELTWDAPDNKSIVLKPVQEEIVEEQTVFPHSARLSSFNKHHEKIVHTNPPDKTNSWLSWCGENDDGMGDENPVDFSIAARFTPADLAAASIKTGDKINKIRFFPYTVDGITITVQIYQGSTSPTNPGALMYEQIVTQQMMLVSYNTVELTTPYHIIASQELWIAYRFQMTIGEQYPAGCDGGPRIANKGDLICYYGEWTNLFALTGGVLNCNWNIEALIGVETTYNIYRDGTLIVPDFSGTSYLDTDFNPLEGYTWSVAAICANGSESAFISQTKPPCLVEYTITASAGANGSITPPGVTTVPQGSNQVYTFGPSLSGYEISEVLVDGSNNPGAVASGTYTFTNVMSNHTIHVNFAAIFVPVTNIINVPPVATVGIPLTLTGNVVPANATHQTIVWSVANPGTTGASISGNTFSATAPGTANILATIANGSAIGTPYTQTFPITVNAGFVPVTNITNVPTTATATLPLTLTGTVVPSNATNQTISWSVSNAGTTGATISGNILNTNAEGTAIVTATITNGSGVGMNYTSNYNIIVTRAQLAGSVTITGNAVFGELLTANTNLSSLPVIPNLGTISYQWARNAVNISGAIGEIYTLVQEDIDSELAVTVVAANCNGSATSGPTAPIAKANQPAPEAPSLANATQTTITLNAITGCEYRRDSGIWQNATTFNDLAPNTTYSFEARKAETNTHLPSEPSPKANFNTLPVSNYVITATVNNTNFGKIEPPGETVVEEGGSVSYTITPFESYKINDVLINSTSQGAITTYTFENVTENGTIAVIFDELSVDESECGNAHVYSHLNSIYIKSLEKYQTTSLQSVEITDMFGRTVYKSYITDAETVITLQVANGIYTVKLISKDDNIGITKISILR